MGLTVSSVAQSMNVEMGMRVLMGREVYKRAPLVLVVVLLLVMEVGFAIPFTTYLAAISAGTKGINVRSHAGGIVSALMAIFIRVNTYCGHQIDQNDKRVYDA